MRIPFNDNCSVEMLYDLSYDRSEQHWVLKDSLAHSIVVI